MAVQGPIVGAVNAVKCVLVGDRPSPMIGFDDELMIEGIEGATGKTGLLKEFTTNNFPGEYVPEVFILFEYHIYIYKKNSAIVLTCYP